ncbi:hypothetical protein BG003_008437 [Podila horticola]|nr:hypothetical protein BG003_008437 [Podila horticola]
MSMDDVKQEPEDLKNQRQEDTDRKRHRTAYDVKTERQGTPSATVAPIITGMANISLQERWQPLGRSPVNVTPLIAGMEHISLQDQLQRHVSPRSTSVDFKIRPLVDGLTNVHIRDPQMKVRSQSAEVALIAKAMAKLTISEHITPPENGRSIEQQSTAATGLKQPYRQPSTPVTEQYLDEDEVYYISRLVDLPKSANLRKQQVASSWLDVLLTRHWLEMLSEAYLAGTHRAAIRKKLWAMAADQVRGVRHSGHDKEMTEAMFGPTIVTRAGTNPEKTGTLSARNPLAAQLRDRIGALRKYNGATALTGNRATTGEDQDRIRARKRFEERENMARSIHFLGRDLTRIWTLREAWFLIGNLVQGRMYVLWRTRDTLQGAANMETSACSWADYMDDYYAFVEAYLAEMVTLSNGSPRTVGINNQH